MTPEQEKAFNEMKDTVSKLESILLGSDNDVRFVSKVRSTIFDGEHTAGKPIATNKNGKKYNLQTV